MALNIISNIQLDMKAPNTVIVYANQYDSAGSVKAQLLNSGESWSVPAGAKAVVMFKKSDNIGGFYDVTEFGVAAVEIDSDRSVIYINYDPQVLTTAGRVAVQINFYQNDQRLSSFAFYTDVQASAVTSGEIASSWLFNILSQEIAQTLTVATTPQAMTDWLEANITQETGYVIDNTLTVAGAASDAQATGKMVTVSNLNPNTVANKVWVKKTPATIDIPTMEDVDEVKSALDPIEYIPMEQGSINVIGGNVDSSKHIRTVGYVYGVFTISCNTDILVSRCIYINKISGKVLRTSDIGLNVYRVACNNGECARIVFRRADNEDITVSDVKLNLYTEKLLSEQMQMFFDTVPLESGGINTAGYVADNDRRIRTACYLKGRFNLLIPDGIKAFRIFYYNDQTFSFDSFVEPTTQLVSIYKAGCVAKIVFSKSNDSLTITPSDITRFTPSQSEMIQQLKNKDNMLYEQIDSFYQDTDKLFVVPGQLIKTYGESIILGGFIVDNSELITTDYIPVIPGELITVKGRGSDASTALVVFYDKNYYPLSSISGASYDNTDVHLTVPSVSAYIRVCKETNKTGIVDCLATRRENNFGPKRLKPQYTYHAYTLPLQTALPDELLGTSASYDQSNVPNYIFELYDSLMERYPNYISKVNLNAETGIGAQSEYPIYMYTFIPPSVTTSDTLDETNEKMKKALLVSGAHPELTGVYGLYLVLKYICEHGNADNLVSSLRYCTEIDVIPVINPYGLANGQAVNENGVDFERNSRTNDWEKMGTAGTKGFTGNAPLSEINSQIVSYLFANNKYDIFVDCHNFYDAAGRSLCWVNPPLAPGYGDELYSVGCNHVKSMTALFKNQYQNTFPMDDFLYGYVTIPHENMRPGTGYVGLPYRAAAQYGTAGVIIESCETCSYINGIYDPTHYVRGTAEVETRAAENIINIIMTLLI